MSGVWVETGSTVWFYEWTRVDEIASSRNVSVLLDCEEERCTEIRAASPIEDDGPVTGSIAGVSRAGDPDDEAQAIFAALVRELVTDLADRFSRGSDGR